MRFASWLANARDTLSLFDVDGCHSNAPQCYVVRSLRLLFVKLHYQG